MNNHPEILWPEKDLAAAWARGEVAGIAAVNLTVQFVMRNGVDRGYLTRQDGAIKRFNTDEQAWRNVESLKSKHHQTTRVPQKRTGRFVA